VIDENLTPEKLGEKIIVDAFDTTSKDGLIKIELTRNDLNSIIYNSTKEIKEATHGIVDQIYLNISGTDYHVYLEAKVKEIAWHTRIDLYMKLEETEDAFILNIDDIGVGKLHHLQKTVNDVLDKVAPDLDVNKVFADLGLQMVLDLHAGTLTYEKDKMIEDIRKMVPKQDDFIQTSFDTFFDEKYLNFNPNKDTFITAEVNLNSFKNNTNYLTNDDEHLIFNNPSWCEQNIGKDELTEFVEPKLNALIDKGIASEIAHLTPLFKLFFTGYKSLEGNEKSTVDTLYSQNSEAFKELGVNDLNTYYGARGEISEEELLSKTLNEIKSRDLSELATGHIGHLYESDINKYIAASGLLGFAAIIAREEQDSLKYNFIAIDNFYCNLLNGEANFVCGLNINGFATNLIFHMPVIEEETSGVHITFGIDKIFFGENEIANLGDVLFRIIGEAFKDDDSFIINKEKHQITFNFVEILDQTNEILQENMIPAVSEDKFSVQSVGEDLSKDGYIDIGFTF
jgi:hypothetical protein